MTLMPAPMPLTQCEPPRLDWSRDGIPAATGFDDIYFSVEGGLDETRTVFLQGCDLPNGWAETPSFVIGETGFGSGLNFLATWEMWTATKSAGHLHFISVEKFPFSKEDLERALSLWPELAYLSERLLSLWPGRVKGLHRLDIAPNVTLTLIHDDIESGLNGLEGQVDAWFLDGFNPSKNQDMWSDTVMRLIAEHSAPMARLATFSVAGSVRRALTAAGFVVEKKKGFGRKRHRLEAIFSPDTAPPRRQISSSKTVRPLIIGGGIAGVSLARAFLKYDIQPTLIDPSDGTAASGNPAALVKPRLDLQDRPESRFFLASYLYALRAYGASDGIMRRGILHQCKTDQEMTRYQKLVAQAPLPSEHFSSSPDDAENRFRFGTALVIDPYIVCQNFAKGCHRVTGRVDHIAGEPGQYHACDRDGVKLATGTHVIFAMGYGAKTFPQMEDMALRYSRGQLSWAVSDDAMLTEPLTYGGYAVPMGGKYMLGATHDRVREANPFALCEEDDVENIAGFEQVTGRTVQRADAPSRASVRVTTADTLPRVLRRAENMWAITGLGSRGFCFGPLLAAALVDEICGQPLPVDRDMWARLQRSL